MFDAISRFIFAKGQAATPYSYVFGPDTLGIGVENAALVRPMLPVPGGGRYGPKYNIHASLNAFEGAGQFPVAISGPMTDTKANGVYMSGQLALAALADLNKSNSGS